MKDRYHVLNLGAGVQSTALALMFEEGLISKDERVPVGEGGDPATPDAAVFADTGDEPQEVYDHLLWLESQVKSFPIFRVSAWEYADRRSGATTPQGDRKIRRDALKPDNGQRFASLPLFTKGGKRVGKLMRQCTSEYKILPITKFIRYDLLGLKFRQHMPKHVRVDQYIGISTDESERATRVRVNMDKTQRWSNPRFPLLEWGMSRSAVIKYLSGRVPHKTPRSACVFCPFHDDNEWLRLKTEDPGSFASAVEFDHALRGEGDIVATRGLKDQVFLHRTCVPLDEVAFQPKPGGPKEFSEECAGMCGL